MLRVRPAPPPSAPRPRRTTQAREPRSHRGTHHPRDAGGSAEGRAVSRRRPAPPLRPAGPGVRLERSPLQEQGLLRLPLPHERAGGTRGNERPPRAAGVGRPWREGTRAPSRQHARPLGGACARRRGRGEGRRPRRGRGEGRRPRISEPRRLSAQELSIVGGRTAGPEGTPHTCGRGGPVRAESGDKSGPRR